LAGPLAHSGRRSRSSTFARKGDAERFLTPVESAKLQGGSIDPSGGRVTFKSYAEEW
jgi:hypothetical protein